MTTKDRARFDIYSPGLSQAVSAAQFLRRSIPGVHLTGVVLPGEHLGAAGRVYDIVVEDAAREQTPDAITVPMGAGSTKHVISRGDVTLGGVTLTTDSLRFSDKGWALALAEAAGVPVPLTWKRPADIAAWPVFYKSAEESEERRRGLAETEERLPAMPEGLIFQEVIEGAGTYGVGFIARDGEVLASHTHFERESFPRLGGSAVLIDSIDSVRLAALTEALVKASSYSGWGLAEFKYCPRREDYVFMEINAKFWASWELALLNQPAFARSLFGIEIEPAGIRRMIFLELAMRRGPSFWPRAIAAVLGGARVRVYPGWSRQLIAALTPRFLFPLVKRLGRG